MNNAEIFNPLLKQERVENELKHVRNRLCQLNHEQKEVSLALKTFQAIQQRNILQDAPTELLVKIIMHMDDFTDVEPLLDAVPRVKTIFLEHKLFEYFFRYEYPRVPEISDMYGFMRSKYLGYSTRFQMPAGKYIIGSLKSTLAKDVYEDLWVKKWARCSGGIFSVKDYNKKTGEFLAYRADTRMRDSDGHIYCLPRWDYIGCVPFSLMKKAKRTNTKIIESRSAFRWRIHDYSDQYIEISWVNMDEETKSLEISYL